MDTCDSGYKVLLGDGGGAMCTFLWGVITRLVGLGLPPDYWQRHFTTSGSNFNSAFMLSHQWQEGKRMWLDWLPQGFWKPFHNDMDYLRTCLSQHERLQTQKFAASNVRVWVSLTNAHTMDSELISLNDSSDPVELLLASVAQPFFTGPRDYEGVAYYDAGLTCQPPLKYVKVMCAKEIWVLLTTPAGERMNTAFARLLSLIALPKVKLARLLWNWPKLRNEVLEQLELETSIRVIRPSAPLPICWRSRDKEMIKRTFEIGAVAAEDFARAQRW